MRGRDQMMSSGNDLWQTPPWILDLVRKVAPIGLDPCTTEKNPTQARNFFAPPAEDGLSRTWVTNPEELTFVNWPYSQSRPWAEACARNASLGTDIIALCAARTDTRWFQGIADSITAICFLSGRVTFVDPRSPDPAMHWSEKKGCFVKATGATFPSMLLYWGPDRWSFDKVFRDYGFCTNGSGGT